LPSAGNKNIPKSLASVEKCHEKLLGFAISRQIVRLNFSHKLDDRAAKIWLKPALGHWLNSGSEGFWLEILRPGTL
jgi:hypothetical protein